MTPCALALVLLVDVSGSIDDREYHLQHTGLIAAFGDPAVHRAIWNQRAVAVTVIEWSSTQRVTAPWTILTGKDDAELFAAQIASTPRTSSGGTHLGDALGYGVGAFADAPCEAERKVIDVSGDGRSNGGIVSVGAAQALADAAGVVVNGLPILGEEGEGDLEEYYRTEVRSEYGFVIVAQDFTDFRRAVRQKLAQEIANAD